MQVHRLLFRTTLLAGISFVASPSIASTIVRDMLNNADSAFSLGERQIACLSIQVAISDSASATASQKQELKKYAARCGLRY